MPPAPSNWTTGAPKWAAIFVLGGASIAGLGWALGRDSSAWGKQQTPPSPAPAGPSAPSATPALPKQPPTPAPSPPKLINPNTATQADLELLPGIGPALATRIIEYRATHAPFKRIEDLDPIKGIGPRLIDKLRPLMTFE